MSLEIAETARRWLADGRPAVVVQVTRTAGSVPREAGTRMLVAADEVRGTIGGGQLELQAIAQARALLAGGGPAQERHLALGPSLGQCCGGALDLGFTALFDSDPESWMPPSPRFHLQLYGAGHVGRAVAALLEGIACRVQWVDERESEFPPQPGPRHIERLCVEPVEAEVSQAPPGAYFLVMTHSHALDMALAEEILRRGDFGWFGLIGSHSKRARFESRLRARGIGDALLARMVCPIGLPGIVGKEPEVIAVSVLAQMLQRGHPSVS